MSGRGGRVVLKSARQIEIMREANQHTAQILDLMCRHVQPGVTTWELDQLARKEIARRGVTSAFLGYRGYPAVICASVNHEIVHGIPKRSTVLRQGDLVGLDFGVVHRGYVGDTARTVAVGTVDPASQRLIDATAECLRRAIEVSTPDHRLSDIGRVVQDYAESLGYGVVRDFVGHGIGTRMHEDPQVQNYYDGPKARLRPGLVIAIEPMLNQGSHGVRVLRDGWTAVTEDGARSAHFEHSLAITDGPATVLSSLT
jgi:methionyl aminopeptidase